MESTVPPDGVKTGRRSIVGWLEERFNLTEMFSFLTNFGLFPAELDLRRPIREAIDEAMQRPLPSYARWPRILGLLSFLLFLLLGGTGALLTFYYQPTASEAYLSVTSIVRDVSFGWFVHQIHRWGAHLLLLILLVRVWRFFFQGMYKAPREALWIVTVLTFLVASHADLTGRLLAWNASGYWTTVRVFEILEALPVLGPVFTFLVGGSRIDSLMLTRFYVLHVVFIPLALMVLFYLHFATVRRVGLSTLPGERRPRAGALKVNLYNLLILTVLILGSLVTLATLLPAPFMPPADPYTTLPGARPPWYLLASHGVIEAIPSALPRWIGGLVVVATLAVAFLLPFIDRSTGRTWRERRVANLLGLAVLALWIVFSLYGYRLEAGP
jgi:ubiquinol-cytochrome c reductase cytochrome b subunit